MLVNSLSDTCTAYTVLDGVGGAASGEVASKTAANKVMEYLKDNYIVSPSDIKDNTEQVSLAVKYANKCVYEMNKEHKSYKDMGTTIALLVTDGQMAYVATVGDTRIYEVKDDKIEQLTEDDTYVNALVKDGIITREEAKRHPDKHVLLKALGINKSITFDVKRLYNVQGRRFLLCTDGLYVCVSEEKIHEIISASDKENICENLVNEANKNGGTDNITAMYIEV